MNFVEYLESEFGLLKIESTDIGLSGVSVVSEDKKGVENRNDFSSQTKSELREYFLGNRKIFDVKLDLSQGSTFYKSVWMELLSIPFGKTCSYMDIALKLNNPGAIRAVGMANGKNPIAIIVPCHRVIGSDKSLTGYAYGLEMKKKLLFLENSSFGYQNKLF